MTKLFVGNLSYQATEADLHNWFTQAGISVDTINVMRDRFTGEARGFGFVEIGDDQHAQQAIQACNGRDFMGRSLVVNEARPMAERGPRMGGGGGGRREGGGGRGGRSSGGGGRNRW
jgi:RNA recognition motif-containing protein